MASEITTENLIEAVNAAIAFGTPTIHVTQEIMGQVAGLVKLRRDLEQYVAAYEDCPVSHRPDKETIIGKLREMLDE